MTSEEIFQSYLEEISQGRYRTPCKPNQIVLDEDEYELFDDLELEEELELE